MKNFVINSSLALVSLLISAALLAIAGELYLLGQYGVVPVGPPAEMNLYHERRGWALKPGRYAYFDVRAFRRAEVTVNDHGLRGAAVSPKPRAGVERMTVLGDSFVFAPPLNDDETITAELQRLAGDGYEILNVSAPGYGTGQQLRLVEELLAEGVTLGRKLVLVFFTNDIQDNLGLEYSTLARSIRQPVFSIDAAGDLQQTVPERPQSAAGDGRGLLARSLFVQFLRYQIEVVVASHPTIVAITNAVNVTPSLIRTPGIVAGWYGDDWRRMWSLTEGVLEHLVRTIGAAPEAPELTIAFMPSPFQVHDSFRRLVESGAGGDPRYASFLDDPGRPQRMLRDLTRRLNVPFIDLTPTLRAAAATGGLLYFPREGHLNPQGCAVVAKVLHDLALKARSPPQSAANRTAE